MSALARIALLASSLLAAPLQAQLTTRIDLAPNGQQANGYAAMMVVSDHWISADNRFVAFASRASNLVVGDTNGVADVFVYDRTTGALERVSVATGGSEANADSGQFGLSISGDGRFVAFASSASNLVAGDNNATDDIFVRDRQLGTTTRVSVDSQGAEGNDISSFPSICADGSWVAFASFASNLVAGDTNQSCDCFVHHLQTGATERVSVSSSGAQAGSSSVGPQLSADGRFVAFASYASNLVSGDTNNDIDIFVRDRQIGSTQLVSLSSAGAQALGASNAPMISGDGRYVIFTSTASNLVGGDTNALADVFLHDLQTGQTELASVGLAGAQANGESYPTGLSDDGRYVLLFSWASNLVPADSGGFADLILRDRLNGTNTRLSLDTIGVQANANAGLGSLSRDGRFATWTSVASNLVAGDTNNFSDVFLRDRTPGIFSDVCDPGVNGVIACPCANPPAGAGQGCDNSSATGGARLESTGEAFLSQDQIVFATSGEKAHAASTLLQGTALASNGIVFGQGVRCLAGTTKRLYFKTAVQGSITAPDLLAGDLTVSARSAALGLPLQPGHTYTYLVYYRDPVVLGGCPATSTYNATQTGSMTWWP